MRARGTGRGIAPSGPRGARRWLVLVALVSTACASTAAEAPSLAASPMQAGAPKYAAFATPLARDHGYLQRASAPDFWALIPYYVAQQSDTACSLASLTMLVNAARHTSALGSDEPLVTQPLLLERVPGERWRRGVAPGGDGVTLAELAELARESLAAFGLRPARLELTPVPEASPEALERLRRVLRESETSARSHVLLNFEARAYVGVGDYGHIAPVGAYDADARRVLVLDPDRTWYEPYWVPDTVALAGMATRDSITGEPRGYLYVVLP